MSHSRYSAPPSPPPTLLRAAIRSLLADGEVRAEEYILNALCPAAEDSTGLYRNAVRTRLGVLLRAHELDLLVGEGYRLAHKPGTSA